MYIKGNDQRIKINKTALMFFGSSHVGKSECDGKMTVPSILSHFWLKLYEIMKILTIEKLSYKFRTWFIWFVTNLLCILIISNWNFKQIQSVLFFNINFKKIFIMKWLISNFKNQFYIWLSVKKKIKQK